jgi:hypothetical protein
MVTPSDPLTHKKCELEFCDALLSITCGASKCATCTSADDNPRNESETTVLTSRVYNAAGKFIVQVFIYLTLLKTDYN